MPSQVTYQLKRSLFSNKKNMQGKCSVYWNDFQKNMTGRFQAVLHDHEFADVTLISHEYKKVKAHKVILSVGSAFFREVLTDSPKANPLIYLRGVDHEVLEVIVEFLYQGWVEVRQEVLQHFMAVASDLKIEGLQLGEEMGTLELNSEKDLGNINTSETVSKDKNTKRDMQPLNDVDDIFQINDYHEKALQEHENIIELSKEGNVILEQNIQKRAEKTTMIPRFPKNSNGMYSCSSCPKLFSDPANVRKHVKEVHIAIFNNCPECDYKTKAKTKLNHHVKSVHLGMTWDCNQCNFQAAYPDSLYSHRKIHKYQEKI